MNTPLRIVIAGGGTGGHLTPALALAEAFVERLGQTGVDIRFVGTRRGIEYRQRDRLGWPLELVPVRGLARRFALSNLLVPLYFLISLNRVKRLLRTFQPAAVIGTGGYVSLPVLKAAQTLGIPSFIQEQNSFPGLSTRIGAPRARCVYLGFDAARSHLDASVESNVVGNPVRAEIGTVSRDEGHTEFKLDPSKTTLLVIGGSQGARALNQAVARGLTDFPPDLQMIWQTGRHSFDQLQRDYPSLPSGVLMLPFIDKMAHAYAAADVGLARAGALTLAELEAARLPALLVPYPHAAGDHQRHNAEAVTATGGARVIREPKLEELSVLAEAHRLVTSGEADQMRAALRGRPAVSVAQVIVDDILASIKYATSAAEEVVRGD